MISTNNLHAPVEIKNYLHDLHEQGRPVEKLKKKKVGRREN
jgi:hypothetical protein